MSGLFQFFLRLFFSLVAAKFFLRVVGEEGLGFLVGLTLLLTGNIYLFDYLEYGERRFLPLVKRPPRANGETRRDFSQISPSDV